MNNTLIQGHVAEWDDEMKTATANATTTTTTATASSTSQAKTYPHNKEHN
jgi:hypothetical protein